MLGYIKIPSIHQKEVQWKLNLIEVLCVYKFVNINFDNTFQQH